LVNADWQSRREILNLSKIASTYLFPILALIVILSTSLGPASKCLGSSVCAFVYEGLAILILYSLSRSGLLRSRLLSKGFDWSVGILFLAVSASFYQAADPLKETLQAQDQDDCTIIVVRQLLAFEFPYRQMAYFGNPCNPLFGAVVPHAFLRLPSLQSSPFLKP